MTNIIDGFVTLVIAIIGWAVSVEYRLGAVLGLRPKIERIEAQLDLLVEHLLGQASRGSSHSRAEDKRGH